MVVQLVHLVLDSNPTSIALALMLVQHVMSATVATALSITLYVMMQAANLDTSSFKTAMALDSTIATVRMRQPSA